MRTRTSTTTDVRDTAACARGFTMIELVAVMLIIALMAGLAGTRFLGTMDNLRLERRVRQVLMMCRFARIGAIEDAGDYRLMIDETLGRLFLMYDHMDEETGEIQEMIVSNSYVRPVELDEGLELSNVSVTPSRPDDGFGETPDFEEGQYLVVFRLDGTADNAVFQVSSSKKVYTLYIHAATGKALAKETEEIEPMADAIDLDLMSEDETF